MLVLPASAAVDIAAFEALRMRPIGPAVMSGRIADIEVVHRDPRVIYVGAATGGVWRSKNAGTTWTPVFDRQHTSSIGAIAVFQPDPRIVWVGTGEGNPRNSAGVGTGLYKSLDGGDTWSRIGFERSERIHRILLHPRDPGIAWVGVMGPTWSDGEQRGVYKTTDGGRSWRRVLFVDARTGVAELVMDPTNPQRLLAAMWEHRREPWFFVSGGPGSALYASEDGGESWQRRTAADGLPQGDLGRIGLAISPSNPRVVYALVEARPTGLYRSNDGGRTWGLVNAEERLGWRPFYYSDIRVDPQDENRLYNLHIALDVSDDGGRTFRPLPIHSVHHDHQDLWISPTDPDFLILGNDGGVYISRDRGASFAFVQSLPLSQFYRVAVDMARPYNVYGGLQDNAGWVGPSALWEQGPIGNAYWKQVMRRGDGFAVIPDPLDGRFGFSTQQTGFMRRFNLVTGEETDIRPPPPRPGVELRFGWDPAVAISPADPRTLYVGSQFLHRSRDGGRSWQVLGGDLTTNDPRRQRQMQSGGITLGASGAESFTTITVIAPSPLDADLLWIGTDDGNVQRSADGGRTWRNVAGRIGGLPRGAWVSDIVPSAVSPDMAYVTFDDHRRGDWTPYVFVTRDGGRSWTSLASAPLEGFVRTLVEDPEAPDLLFLGTEFGLYVSANGGGAWQPWTHGLPTVQVSDMLIHPRDHDLVVATHGRGIFILDDLTPLRALARDPSLTARSAHVFEPLPAIQSWMRFERGPQILSGDAGFAGTNRPPGALVSFWVAASADERAAAEIWITDVGGRRVRRIETTIVPGMNRIAWDLRESPLRDPWHSPGPHVVPGVYRVTVRVGSTESTQSLHVLPDPDGRWTLDELRERHGFLLAAGRELERLQRLVARMDEILAAHDRPTQNATAFRKALIELRERVMHESAWASPANVLERVYSGADGSLAPPTQAQRGYLALAVRALDEGFASLERLESVELTGVADQSCQPSVATRPRPGASNPEPCSR